VVSALTSAFHSLELHPSVKGIKRIIRASANDGFSAAFAHGAKTSVNFGRKRGQSTANGVGASKR